MDFVMFALVGKVLGFILVVFILAIIGAVTLIKKVL
jgi:hypothetical protein